MWGVRERFVFGWRGGFVLPQITVPPFRGARSTLPCEGKRKSLDLNSKLFRSAGWACRGRGGGGAVVCPCSPWERGRVGAVVPRSIVPAPWARAGALTLLLTPLWPGVGGKFQGHFPAGGGFAVPGGAATPGERVGARRGWGRGG